MDHMMDKLKKEDPDIRYIYLNMQVGNKAAVSFYKKYGFEILETMKDFYHDIEPRDCYYMRKDMHPEKPEKKKED